MASPWPGRRAASPSGVSLAPFSSTPWESSLGMYSMTMYFKSNAFHPADRSIYIYIYIHTYIYIYTCIYIYINEKSSA